LSDTAIATAAAAAKTAGQDGKFLIALVNTSGQPPLNDLKNHPSRAKLMAASLARGSRGGDYDNRTVVSAIAKKRAARAALLGYAHHAAYQLEEQTVGSVEVLNKLLAQLAPPAVANAQKETADMQAIVDAEKGGFTLGAADWDLYSEKVRVARYAFDESQLRPYYELNRVLIDGVFFAATKLYGITFKERTDLFQKALDADETLAQLLASEGFETVEEIAYVPQSELSSIEEFNEDIVKELRSRARDVLLTQAIATEENLDSQLPADDLLLLEGMQPDLALALARRGVRTREDLAEQAVDDLLDIQGLTAEEAGQLIMKAREHWFAAGHG
jgi:transcription termination factor NusA